jgi:release factor glutamine methyltransferase
MTLRDALTEASNRIARRDAETLLAHVIERDRAWLLAHAAEPLAAAQLEAFRALTARRAAHEPLQHLTGAQEFYGLRLRVTPDVLIPRPETEHLVEAVLLWAAQVPAGRTLRIADVGTGSGAIVIALATHLAGAEFFAIDNSAAALAIAQENARQHRCLERIRFVQSDLLTAFLPGNESGMDGASSKINPERDLSPELPLDAIVSNPPYVALGDATTMQPEVVGFEPHNALFAGDDGMAVYRRLIPAASLALRPGGLLALEFGFGQREALRALIEAHPRIWRNPRFLDDYAGIPRVALAERE